MTGVELFQWARKIPAAGVLKGVSAFFYGSMHDLLRTDVNHGYKSLAVSVELHGNPLFSLEPLVDREGRFAVMLFIDLDKSHPSRHKTIALFIPGGKERRQPNQGGCGEKRGGNYQQ